MLSRSQILIVQQYKQEKITRLIVILKKGKTHFSHLTNSTETTTAAKKSRQIFLTYSSSICTTWGQDELSQRSYTLSHKGHVREEFQMHQGKIGRQP